MTEAGFAADLGAEKFVNIKCRQAGLKPNGAVLVATIRALKYHGGVEKEDLSAENVEALKIGCENLRTHVENLQKYGLPVIVAINRFPTDTPEELDIVRQFCEEIGACLLCVTHLNKGGGSGNALSRVTGSIAFAASARASLVITRDPDDPDRRLMLPLKK